MINEQGEWKSESEHEDDGTQTEHEVGEGETHSCDIQPDMGDCFVSRRVLSINAAREEKGQQHNIFHTRGTIKNKVCSIIVDNGSCYNIASSDLVERLGLKQRRHPSPYKMQWLNDCGTLRVSNMVTVQFFIGKYQDQVERDVVPMQACQLLLGRPWLFDHDVQISSRANRLSFQYKGERISLLPLTPEEILMDDMKRKERVSEKHLSEIHQHSERENPKPNNTPQLKLTKIWGKQGLVMMARKRDMRELREPNSVFFVHLYKETFLSTNDLPCTTPSVVAEILQRYEDVFPKEVPPGLPPKRGIEHQIDLVPGAPLANHPPYRTNPEEIKEIQ